VKKVLVVGNTSILAERIILLLKKQGYYIKTAGRNGNPDYYIDMTQNITGAYEAFDVIINCVACFNNNDPIQCELINSIGLIKIALLAQKVGCSHLIDISSIFTYDHPHNKYFDFYGISKNHGSQYLQLLQKRNGFNYTTLKLPQIYDELGKQAIHQSMFYRIIKLAKLGQEIIFYGNKDVVRNFMFIDDVAMIIEKIIKLSIFGIFDCIHPDSYKLSEIAKIACEIARQPCKITFDKSKENIPGYYIPKDAPIYKIIGYYPETDLYTGISKIYDNMEDVNGKRVG
jgi:nucleoside-diphosphate-sugar epimerase